ncbi:hypothetical protein CCUS01_08646, partial [Colletotrichum cuscutae]
IPSAAQTGVTTLSQTDPTSTTTVISFVPLTGAFTTLISTATEAGVITLPQADPAGITTVLSFVPPITGALTTVVSSATQSGVTTLPQTDPAGTTTVVTFVPITGALTTVVSSAKSKDPLLAHPPFWPTLLPPFTPNVLLFIIRLINLLLYIYLLYIV